MRDDICDDFEIGEIFSKRQVEEGTRTGTSLCLYCENIECPGSGYYDSFDPLDE